MGTWRSARVVCGGVLWWVCQVTGAAGQTDSRVTDTLTTARLADTLQLSRQNLVPFAETITRNGEVVPRTAYYLDYYQGRLVALDTAWVGRWQVAYRVFAGRVAGPIGLLPPPDTVTQAARTPYDLSFIGQLPPGYLDSGATPGYVLPPRWEATAQLQRSGSISRAVTVGSGRDASVTSDFRLNLNGTIGSDIGVSAAITDENLPIQPTGTTQQLTDFDRIYIRLTQGKGTLTFGDLELAQQGLSFGNYYRDVLGLSYRYKSGPRELQVGGASSKGSFTTNSFVGVSGKQGPYRLQGRSGEQFFVVLAGSEKIYLNGRLLTRGQDRDYIIDYNTAELTFTPANVIDANTRIVVDFTYLDRNYSRSFISASYADSLFDKKLALRVGFTREADDPNAPLDLVLSPDDEAALAQAGDDPTRAVVSGIDSVGYSPTEPRYALTDTLVDGTLYPDVLVLSTDPEAAVYQVSFTFVGAGNGDYIRQGSTVNANRFRWSPPEPGGTPTGDYAPVRRLPLPSAVQVGFVAGTLQLAPRLQLLGEAAVSSADANRFSALDDGNNAAAATRWGLRLQPAPRTEGLRLGAEVGFQYVDARYQNLDRVYQREYGRVWNYDDLGSRANERVVEGKLTLLYRRSLSLLAEGGYRSYGDSLRTQRLALTATSTDSSALLASYQLTYLVTQNRPAGTTSTWQRHEGELTRLLGKPSAQGWRLGSRYWLERRREAQNDSLLAGSFEFADLTPYLGTYGNRKFQLEARFNLRYDRAVALGALRDRSRTLRPGLHLAYRPGPRLDVTADGSYQAFSVLDPTFATPELLAGKSYLFDGTANYRALNQVVVASAFYRAASEQVARRERVYLEVPAGQGQYEWFDYNEDGVEDLNEFERSNNPLLANYVQLFTPTQALVPAVGVTLGGTLRLTGARLFKDPPTGPLGKLLANASTQTLLRASQQATRPSDVLGSYGFAFEAPAPDDTTVISSGVSFRQGLYLWRNHPTGDLGFDYVSTTQRQLLNSGFELADNQQVTARQRYNFSPRRSLEHAFELTRTQRQAVSFAANNYTVSGWSTQPAFVFQFTERTRLRLGAAYSERDAFRPQEPTAPTIAVSNYRLSLEGRHNFGGRNSIVGRLTAVSNTLTGEPTGSLRFELLEGLAPGQNAVWNLFIVFYLTESLELSLVHDGRASALQAPQYAFRTQLRAIF
ncbi:MAG: hypothetical protein SFY70_03770 [Bacteroidia bacterium]|nr:hypothetical protein [Bacteroidia bacterium]